jgi:receptor protein-tyrosine kinase
VALEAARTKLAVLALLGPENVHLSQGAVPPNRQSSPRLTLDVIIGGLAGLLVGLALAFATEQLDPRLRRPEEVERATGLPVLATIPQRRSLARPVAGQSYQALGSMEPFERLVSVLRHVPAVREARTVLVISPEVASGQTTVALRLALAAAGGLSINTLLVEADLRRPRVAELAGLSTDRGLSTMLSGESQELEVQQLSLRAGPSSNGRRLGLWRPARQAQERAATAVVETPVSGASAESDLTILPAGPPTAEATALLASDGMRNLMRIWAESYDLTVIDGPPPNRVADVIPLANEADAVLVVARLGKDTVQELTRLRIELTRIGVEPLGVVANFARQTKNPYAL